MKLSKFTPFHPFLFCIYPILYLYSINQIETPIVDIIMPIFISIGITTLLIISWKFLFKDLKRGALIITVLLVVIFSYGHIYEILNSDLVNTEIRHRYLLLLFLIFFITLTMIIIKKVKSQNLNLILNVVGISLIVILLPNFLLFENTSNLLEEITNDNLSNTYSDFYILKDTNLLKSDNRPNIFYILLDGYGGTKRMNEDLNFDNYVFLDELKSRGFIVSDNSNSNYASSKWSLTSIMNMVYLPSIELNQTDNEHAELLSFMLSNNEVMRNLKILDYEIIDFQPEGFFIKSFSNIDRNYCSQEVIEQSKFVKTLLRTTILNLLNHNLQIDSDRKSILCGFSETSKLLDDNTSPLFVNMHLRLPHPPYVFGPNGEFIYPGRVQTEEGSFENEQGYVDSIKFANSKVIPLIDEILIKDKNAIIIIQSDHGYDFGIDYENPSILSLKQRFSNLNAIYYPFENNVFYDGFTPVNTFSIIFNNIFETDYPILEDRMFYHPYGGSYIYKQPKFIDVTEKILN